MPTLPVPDAIVEVGGRHRHRIIDGGERLNHRARVRRIVAADLDHVSLIESPTYQDRGAGGRVMVALPTGTRRTLSSGDCDILIARHHRERRMTAVVTLTDITGAHWAIQLADGDLLNLRKTFDVLYAAGPDQVAEWWRDLNTKRVDGPT